MFGRWSRSLCWRFDDFSSLKIVSQSTICSWTSRFDRSEIHLRIFKDKTSFIISSDSLKSRRSIVNRRLVTLPSVCTLGRYINRVVCWDDGRCQRSLLEDRRVERRKCVSPQGDHGGCRVWTGRCRREATAAATVQRTGRFVRINEERIELCHRGTYTRFLVFSFYYRLPKAVWLQENWRKYNLSNRERKKNSSETYLSFD